MSEAELRDFARRLLLIGYVPSEAANELVRAGANVDHPNRAMKIVNAVYAELEREAQGG